MSWSMRAWMAASGGDADVPGLVEVGGLVDDPLGRGVDRVARSPAVPLPCPSLSAAKPPSQSLPGRVAGLHTTTVGLVRWCPPAWRWLPTIGGCRSTAARSAPRPVTRRGHWRLAPRGRPRPQHRPVRSSAFLQERLGSGQGPRACRWPTCGDPGQRHCGCGGNTLETAEEHTPRRRGVPAATLRGSRSVPDLFPCLGSVRVTHSGRAPLATISNADRSNASVRWTPEASGPIGPEIQASAGRDTGAESRRMVGRFRSTFPPFSLRPTPGRAGRDATGGDTG